MVERKTIFIIFLIFSFFILFKYSGLSRYITLEHLKQHIDQISIIVSKHYFLSVLIFILGYAITIMIAIPGFAPLTMVGGYVFGVGYGALYALIGSFSGSLISYVAVKLYLQGYILEHYRNTINRFTSYVSLYGISNTLLLLHFLTVIPFFLINAFAAVTGIPLKTFIWTTLLGSVPLVILYAFAGMKLQEIDNIKDIFSLPIILVFIILILIAIIPMIIRRLLIRSS
jgi:uncharacterized membrane protein YdjX (TVP38/TMEM64 family)